MNLSRQSPVVGGLPGDINVGPLRDPRHSKSDQNYCLAWLSSIHSLSGLKLSSTAVLAIAEAMCLKISRVDDLPGTGRERS
jgi:hypothetical protein